MPWKAIYNMKAVRKNFNIKMEYDILLPYNLGQPKFSGQVILKTLRPCQYTKVCIMFPSVFTTKKQLQKYWIKTPTIELRFLFQVKQLCTWWNKKQLWQLQNCDGMISLYLKFLQASLRRLKILRLPKVCTFFFCFSFDFLRVWLLSIEESMIKVELIGDHDRFKGSSSPFHMQKVKRLIMLPQCCHLFISHLKKCYSNYLK